MRFFIDTANVEDIRKANGHGVICGCHTNPTSLPRKAVFEEEIAENISPEL